MADWRRRIDKVAAGLSNRACEYEPRSVTRLVFTRRWPDDEPDPRTLAERESLKAAEMATADQIAAWATEDARRHDWRQPYTLVVVFNHEDYPQGATFNVPWRTGGRSVGERALALDDRQAWAWQNKGKALGALGRHDEALAAFDRALALDSNSAIGWYNKGYALWSLKRYVDAVVALGKAIVLDPKYALAWSKKAEALHALGRTRAAKEAEQWAKALFYTPPSGEGNYADVVHKRYDEGDYADVVRKRYGDAIEQSKEAYARARDEVLSRYNRAKAGDYSV
jgi:tetratricopeptide (TPR) repeat protein